MAEQEFPPVTQVERAFFGESILDDVDALVEDWTRSQERLMALASDTELLALSGSQNLSASEQRIRELTVATRVELEQLRRDTVAWVGGPAVEAEVAAGTTAAMESVATQGAEVVVGGALGLANTQTIRILSEEILLDAEFAISSTERIMRRHFRATQQTLVTEAALNESLLISETRLENANRRAKRLAALFAGKATDGQFVNVNGRFFQLSNYADLISRTRLAEAAVEGSFQATLAMGIDLVRISDHGPTDRFCDPHAGKVFSVSGRSSRYPRLRERPPFHPRCRHALLPFVEELKSERELAFVRARTRDEVPAGMSIEEFFRASA